MKPENRHSILMQDLLRVIEQTRVGCGKGPAKTLDELELTPMAALCELAEYVQGRFGQHFEAGWRARGEQLAGWSDKRAVVFSGMGREDLAKKERADAQVLRLHTPPAAQPASEPAKGKP